MMRLHTCDPACVAERQVRGFTGKPAKGTIAISRFSCPCAPSILSDADLPCPTDTDRPMCGDGAAERAREVMEFDCLLRITFVIIAFQCMKSLAARFKVIPATIVYPSTLPRMREG